MFGDKADTLVLFSSVNRYYFSSVNTSFGCVILQENKRIFLTDFRYYGSVSKALDGWDVVLASSDDLYESINEQLTRMNAETVGYEDKSMTVSQFAKLQAACGAFRLEPISDYILKERSIKTEDEIKKIASAQQIGQKALNKVISIIRPGVTEREVVANIIYEMQMLGAEGAAFEPIVAFGENGAYPHYRAGKRKLEKNDMVLVDVGATVDGYCSDMTRTFCVGSPSDKMERIHKTVRDAQEYALANIKAGMTCHEADSFAREYITAHGFGEGFGHSLGHGVGLELREFPRIRPNSDIALEPNMIVTIGPGVYYEGLGGVRIEDLAVVKEDGLLNLTNFDKNINL